MSILILADHDDGQLAGATLNTVTAASQIGGDIDILVAGDASGDVAKAAALDSSSVQRYLDGKTPKKIIVVQNRIINVVA